MAVQPPLSSAIIITAVLHIWTLQMSSQTSRIRQNKMFADKKEEIKVLFSAAKEIRCSRHEYGYQDQMTCDVMSRVVTISVKVLCF